MTEEETHYTSEQEDEVEAHGGPSEATKAAFQRQLQEHGRTSLEKSRRSIQEHIAQHLEKLERYRHVGGHTSSVAREIHTFRRQIEAIEQILREVAE